MERGHEVSVHVGTPRKDWIIPARDQWLVKLLVGCTVQCSY